MKFLLFLTVQNKSFPIVLYNEEQEELMHNPYFETLLQFLGLHMPEDVGLVFPRIPHFWTIQNLVEKASQIGDLTEGMVYSVKWCTPYSGKSTKS